MRGTGGGAAGIAAGAAAAADDAREVCLPTAGGLETALAAAAGGAIGTFLDDNGGGVVGNSGPKAGGIPMAGTSISFNIPRIVSCIISQNLRPTSISDFIFLAVRAFTTRCLSSCSSEAAGPSADPSRFLLATDPPAVLGLLLTLTSSAFFPDVAAVVVSLVLTCRTRCRLIRCTVAVDRINPFNACPPSSCRDTQSVLSFQSHFSNKPGISFSGIVGKGGNGDDAAAVAVGVLDTTVVLLPLAPAAEPAALGGGILGCCVAAAAVAWFLERAIDAGGVVALFGEPVAAATAKGGGGFCDNGDCKFFLACAAAAAAEACAAPGGTKFMAAG